MRISVCVVGVKNGSGLKRPRALQPRPRRVAGDVEQERSRTPGVGEVRRNLRTHGSGADDSSGLDSKGHCAGFRVLGFRVRGSGLGSGFRSGSGVPDSRFRDSIISAQRVLCAEVCLRREHTKILWHGNLRSRCGIRSWNYCPSGRADTRQLLRSDSTLLCFGTGKHRRGLPTIQAARLRTLPAHRARVVRRNTKSSPACEDTELHLRGGVFKIVDPVVPGNRRLFEAADIPRNMPES